MTDPLVPDDLETRLRRVFHAADLPTAPASLRGALERVADASVRRHEGDTAKRGKLRGWSVLGLAAVLVIGGVVAVAVGQRGPSVVPPGPSDGVAPSDLPAAEAVRLTYQVQWSDAAPENPEDLRAIEGILRERLDAKGIAGAVVDTTPAGLLTVDLPAGIDPEPIRRLLGQAGEIAFVPLGTTPALAGDAIDLSRFDPLFRSEGILDAAVGTGQTGQRVVTIRLDATAAQTFGDWTTDHIGEFLAITSDGVALTVPLIDSAIPGGSVEISKDGIGGWDLLEAAQLAAIIGSGSLPVPIAEVGTGPQSSGGPASPSPRPPIAARQCEPPLATDNPQLTCELAVRAALAILPAGHPPIATIAFRHQCFDPNQPDALLDCAVEAFGIVDIIYVDGRPLTAIGVRLDGTRTPQAFVLPLRGVTEVEVFTLAPAAGDVGCDSIMPPYRSFVMHIDPSASQSVWAMADTRARLHVVWGSVFRGLVGPPARVVDDHGVEVARDGTVVTIPDRSWPSLAGRFVCPSPDTVYVFNQAPPA